MKHLKKILLNSTYVVVGALLGMVLLILCCHDNMLVQFITKSSLFIGGCLVTYILLNGGSSDNTQKR